MSPNKFVSLTMLAFAIGVFAKFGLGDGCDYQKASASLSPCKTDIMSCPGQTYAGCMSLTAGGATKLPAVYTWPKECVESAKAFNCHEENLDCDTDYSCKWVDNTCDWHSQTGGTMKRAFRYSKSCAKDHGDPEN